MHRTLCVNAGFGLGALFHKKWVTRLRAREASGGLGSLRDVPQSLKGFGGTRKDSGDCIRELREAPESHKHLERVHKLPVQLLQL
jgi:hypothetical protein